MASILKVKDGNGNIVDIPAIKGEPVGKERPTATACFFDANTEWKVIVQPMDSSMGFIVRSVFTDDEGNPAIPSAKDENGNILPPIYEGTEIKTIELLVDGEFVDIHRLNELDDIPYILNMNRVYRSNNWDFVFALVFCPAGNNTATDIALYEGIDGIKITYYTD